MFNITCFSSRIDAPNLSLEAAKPIDESVKVKVVYKDRIKGQKLIGTIKREIKNPEVIFWYIGSRGLREEGVKYYRKDLNKLLEEPSARCSLYDLTAWLPLVSKEDGCTVQDFNKNADLINQFAIPHVQCLKSCDFFSWLTGISSQQKLDKLKGIFKRPFIYEASKDIANVQRTVGEIFKSQCPILEELYGLDVSKCYSALQYVEGIYLIKILVKQALLENLATDEINLVFALPNNEDCYYKDEKDSFAIDINAILEEEFGDAIRNKTVNVLFYPFEFNNGTTNRPYNTGKEIIEELKDPLQIVELPQTKNGGIT
jgi:hypothetical protein